MNQASYKRKIELGKVHYTAYKMCGFLFFCYKISAYIYWWYGLFKLNYTLKMCCIIEQKKF